MESDMQIKHGKWVFLCFTILFGLSINLAESAPCYETFDGVKKKCSLHKNASLWFYSSDEKIEKPELNFKEFIKDENPEPITFLEDGKVYWGKHNRIKPDSASDCQGSKGDVSLTKVISPKCWLNTDRIVEHNFKFTLLSKYGSSFEKKDGFSIDERNVYVWHYILIEGADPYSFEPINPDPNQRTHKFYTDKNKTYEVDEIIANDSWGKLIDIPVHETKASLKKTLENNVKETEHKQLDRLTMKVSKTDKTLMAFSSGIYTTIPIGDFDPAKEIRCYYKEKDTTFVICNLWVKNKIKSYALFTNIFKEINSENYDLILKKWNYSWSFEQSGNGTNLVGHELEGLY